MIVFVYMFAQREYDLYFYVKRDCLPFSVNVKLFFEFFVMRESVFIRGIGDPLFACKSVYRFACCICHCLIWLCSCKTMVSILNTGLILCR